MPAPKQYDPNQIFFIGDGFGLFVYFEKFEETYFKNVSSSVQTQNQEAHERNTYRNPTLFYSDEWNESEANGTIICIDGKSHSLHAKRTQKAIHAF